MWILESNFWWNCVEIRCGSKYYFDNSRKLDIIFQASNCQQVLEEIVQFKVCGSKLFALNSLFGAGTRHVGVHNLMVKRARSSRTFFHQSANYHSWWNRKRQHAGAESTLFL